MKNIFFPQNSTKQGIVTDFVTAQLKRGTFKEDRSLAWLKLFMMLILMKKQQRNFGLIENGDKTCCSLLKDRRRIKGQRKNY